MEYKANKRIENVKHRSVESPIKGYAWMTLEASSIFLAKFHHLAVDQSCDNNYV